MVDVGVIDIAGAEVSGSRSEGKQDDIALHAQIQELNRKFAFVLYGESASVMKLDEGKIRFLPEATFLSLLRNRWYFSKKDNKPKQIGPAWLCSEDRRSYDDVVFYPGKTSGNVFNIWNGFAYEPKAGNCDLFLDHMRANICAGDETNFNWLLDWMADAVQKPERKNWTAVLMESKEEGTGKGFFAGHFGKLFGSHYAAYNKPNQLLGRFNSHLEDKLIVFLDEGSLTEKDAYDYAKSLISEPTINIEPKGRSMREVNSYHRIIMASNDRHILRTGLHDRRWMVLRVAPNCVNNIPYFRAVDAQMEDGGYEALLHLLTNREYDEDNVKTTIKTIALNYQKDQNLSDVMRWWKGILTDGRIGAEIWPMSISTKALYECYIIWCDQMRINIRQSSDWLPRRLNEEAGTDFKSKGPGGAKFYELPALAELRDAFVQSVGYEINWEE